MLQKPRRHPRSGGRSPGLLAALLVACSPLHGQSLGNPGFEAESFTGTIAGNTPLTGWTTTTPGLAGLNSGADNGTGPGGNVAFISTGGNLSAVVSGLVPGQTYHVAYRANASNGQVPYLTFSTDAGGPAESVRLEAVGGSSPYRHIAQEFAATASSHVITISNTRTSGTHTLLLDGFSVSSSAGTWSYRHWTGDGTSGIDSQYAYSHAVNFATSDAVTINGVAFNSSNTTNAVTINNLLSSETEYNVPGRIAISGLGVTAGFGSTALTDPASDTLARSFRGGDLNISLSNLKPNSAYVATIYGAGWDSSTNEHRYRATTFSVSTSPEKRTVDINQFGTGHGIAVECHYTSDSQGNAVISFAATGIGQWHTSGFSNREAQPDDGETQWSHHSWNSDDDIGIDGGHVYTHAYSFGSSGNAVINGVPFTDLNSSDPATGTFSSYRLHGLGWVTDTFTNISGSGNALTPLFHWAYTPNVMTFSGLTPGKKYVFTAYSLGFGSLRELLLTGSAGGKPLQVNQDFYGNDNGICMDYTYVAPPSGQVLISVAGFGSSYTPHLYAVTNREAEFSTGIAPVITTQPQDATIAAGTSHTLTFGVTGSPELSYQWKLDGQPIPGANGSTYTIESVSGADAGDYTCTVSNAALPAGITTAPARITVKDAIPGLFATGTRWDGGLLATGEVDPHYVFETNPHGTGETVFAMSRHPAWAAADSSSRWTGPVASYEQSGAAAMDPYYVYRTVFHLAGFDPATVTISGEWLTDNHGIAIRLNGTPLGFSHATSSSFYIAGSFTIDATVIANAGAVLHTDQPNTLDFVVANEGAGPTGLLVRNLRGLGVIAPGTAPVISVSPSAASADIGDMVALGVVASGTGPLSFQWKKNGVNVGSPTSDPYLQIEVTDPSVYGDYTVTVSNAVLPGGVTSAAATVSATPLPVYQTTTEKDEALVIDTFSLLDFLVASGISSANSFTAAATTSVAGGTITVEGDFLTYTPPAGYVGTDSFTYTVDGSGGERTAEVEIAVTGLPDSTTPGPVTLAIGPGGGSVTASFTGTPGTSYTLERSTTLVGAWEIVGSQVALASGEVVITDDDPPADKAFYRISY